MTSFIKSIIALHIIFAINPFLIASNSTSSDYEKFKKTYNISNTGTEQSNSLSHTLSNEFTQDPATGLKILTDIDRSIISGVEHYKTTYADRLSTILTSQINEGGRVFFCGSGTSGRIAVLLAKKWQDYFSDNETYKNKVQAILAGGMRALIKAKENQEDSLAAGTTAIKQRDLSPKDILILISASGSATFNVGAAQEAHKKGAHVFYFYNSQSIPERTSSLFKDKIATPLLIEIDPPAISGSTRLHPATIAIATLGVTLEMTIKKLFKKPVSTFTETTLLDIHTIISAHLSAIAHLISLITDTLEQKSPNGHITYLCPKSTFLEALIDTSELPPTFSITPPRSINENSPDTRFRAYCANTLNTKEIWCYIFTNSNDESEIEEAATFIISTIDSGHGSFQARPTYNGNLVFVCIKAHDLASWKNIQPYIKNIKANGGTTILIILQTKGAYIKPAFLQKIISFFDSYITINGITEDILRISETIILKQILNLISNGIMISKGRVLGNEMIAMEPSNNKLIARAIRILMKHTSAKSEQEVYQLLLRILSYKRKKTLQSSQHLPPTLQIAIKMIEEKQNLEAAVACLSEDTCSI